MKDHTTFWRSRAVYWKLRSLVIFNRDLSEHTWNNREEKRWRKFRYGHNISRWILINLPSVPNVHNFSSQTPWAVISKIISFPHPMAHNELAAKINQNPFNILEISTENRNCGDTHVARGRTNVYIRLNCELPPMKRDRKNKTRHNDKKRIPHGYTPML